jgi:hypothetical protein
MENGAPCCATESVPEQLITAVVVAFSEIGLLAKLFPAKSLADTEKI